MKPSRSRPFWEIGLILLLLCDLVAYAQDQKSLKVDGKGITYTVLQPTGDISGVLLLLPGKGENAKSVLKKTSLPEILGTKGFVTIVPNLKYNLFADEVARKQLSQILATEATARSVQRLFIGGFSAGGSVAMSFAEYLISQGGEISVTGIFVIDPPLDLQRLYGTSRKMRKYECSSAQEEGQQTIDMLDRVLGGSPYDEYNHYLSNSPFMASEPDGGNARWLKQVPVRLYSEPDIAFVKERYCAEFEEQDLNVNDLEKLNKLLTKMGNDRCELIITKGRGYHTWNIADPEELAAWIAKMD